MIRSAVDLARTTSDSEQLELPDAKIVRHVASTDTAVEYTLIDYDAPPYFTGPSAHTHAATEWIYIVAGMMAFTLGDETIMLERGETLTIPPGTTHTFWNPTAHPARLRVIVMPDGIEGYSAELHALIISGGDTTVGNSDVLTNLAAQHDILPPATLPDGETSRATLTVACQSTPNPVAHSRDDDFSPPYR